MIITFLIMFIISLLLTTVIVKLTFIGDYIYYLQNSLIEEKIRNYGHVLYLNLVEKGLIESFQYIEDLETMLEIKC